MSGLAPAALREGALPDAFVFFAPDIICRACHSALTAASVGTGVASGGSTHEFV